MFAAVGAVIVLIVVGVVVALANRPVVHNSGILTFESQGQTHIDANEQHPPYNSNPPTSGWHFPTPAPWGIYDQQRPDEELVHNLEHGGIWISYKDANDKATIQQLKDIVNQFPNTYIIMTYRPENDWPIAVAAWKTVIKFDGVDRDKIVEFLQHFMYQGPEKV